MGAEEKEELVFQGQGKRGVGIKIGREGDALADRGAERGRLLGSQDVGKLFPSKEAVCSQIMGPNEENVVGI